MNTFIGENTVMPGNRFIVLRFSALSAAAPRPRRQAAPSQRPRHHEVRADQLPKPYATRSAGNPAEHRRASGECGAAGAARLSRSTVYAEDFDDPRNMALAPNGDVFVAETGGGRITILRGKQRFTFASDLDNRSASPSPTDFSTSAPNRRCFVFRTRRGRPRRAARRSRSPRSLPADTHAQRDLQPRSDRRSTSPSVGGKRELERTRFARRSPRCNPTARRVAVFAAGLRNPVGLAIEPRQRNALDLRQ